MKRIFVFIIFVVVIYAIYYDLREGTLPAEMSTRIAEENNQYLQNEESEILYFEHEVKRGETVLSIVEQNLQDSIPVSIEKVIHDFKKLNNGMKPEEIQFGKRYKFPFYEPSSSES